MDNQNNKEMEYTVDIVHIAKQLWKRVWIIVISAVLAAAAGFSIATFIIPPKYSSSVALYVNNKNLSLGGVEFSLSASDLTASQNLVKTYGVILNTRTTLEKVIDRADVDYEWKELSKMIEYGSLNGTEIMYVTVTSENPYEASEIANAILIDLKDRINSIIDGATINDVETAVPDFHKVSPSITKYTAVGLVLGLLVSTIVLVIIILLDDTIHDEDYVIKAYNYPVLAKIPDLTDTGTGKKYGYYYSYSQKKHGEVE